MRCENFYKCFKYFKKKLYLKLYYRNITEKEKFSLNKVSYVYNISSFRIEFLNRSNIFILSLYYHLCANIQYHKYIYIYIIYEHISRIHIYI